MKKRGMTIVELIVAITLFVVVITLVLGAFVSMSRTKLLISGMKESQQKIRLITEMMTRFGKEAHRARIVSGSNPTDPIEIQFIFYGRGTTGARDLTRDTAKVFRFDNSGPDGNGLGESYKSLKYFHCGDDAINQSTNYLIDTTTITGDTPCVSEEILSNSLGLGYAYGIAPTAPGAKIIKKVNTIPPTFAFEFELRNMTTSNRFFDDSITVSSIVILENIR